jgi:hypothetical protein
MIKDSPTKYWLEHEYADGTWPYFTCGDWRGLEKFEELEIGNDTNDINSNNCNTKRAWLYRPRDNAAAHVQSLINNPELIHWRGKNEIEILANGDGLKFVAAEINHINKHMQIERMLPLLKFCMGAQYFSIITSKYFPGSNMPAVKVCKFYAYVVLGKQARAEKLYKEVGHLIDSRCSCFRDGTSLILANIRCLFQLRSGTPATIVLAQNENLVDYSKSTNDKFLSAILLLNQARLRRIVGMTDCAIEKLEESYTIVKSLNSFKIVLYYLLQLSVIRGEHKGFLNMIERMRLYSDNCSTEAFGWRIAKLMRPDLQAEIIMGEWPLPLTDIMKDRDKNLSTLFDNLTGNLN